MKKDDLDFIDLDSTMNWSQLDVERELDNRGFDETTGKRLDYAKGFGNEGKKDESDVLLDGLTSGLNYIPEEFLMAAQEKKDIEMEAIPEEEKPDVSWAYRDEGDEDDDEEPFIAIADLKRAEEEQRARIANEVQAEVEKELALQKKREENHEALVAKVNKNAENDADIQLNIEARKQARKEAEELAASIAKASAEAQKAKEKEAEAEMYAEDQAFADKLFGSDEEYTGPIMTKEERIAAANRNRHNVTAPIKSEEVKEAVEEVDEEPINKRVANTVEEQEYEVEPPKLSTGDTGVIYYDNETFEEIKKPQEYEEVTVKVKKKKKQETSAVEEYLAWADSDGEEDVDENLAVVPVKKKKKKPEDNNKSGKKPPKGGSGKKSTGKKKRKKKTKHSDDESFWGRIFNFFENLSAIDYAVACTGILVIVAAIITGVVYSNSKVVKAQIAEFAPLGQDMQGIGIAGSGKLVAVADAKRALAEIPVEEEQEPEEEIVTEYNEKEDELEGNISVTMSLTSVKKDLKIKFINAKTKKLVGNYSFKVSIEDAKGKKYSAEDDDKDGIIYLKSVEPGKAKVSMEAMPDEKNLTFSTEQVTVNIKENIEFKKIDVADEVKTESQVNAAKEDTAQGVATEGALKDTVEWVESTKTALKDGYTPVPKANVLDPAKITPTVSASAKNAYGVSPVVIAQKQYASRRMLGNLPYMLIAGAANTGEPTDTPTPTPDDTTPTGDVSPTPTGDVTPTPTDEVTPTPSPSPTPTPEISPTPTPTPTPTAGVDPKTDTTSLLKDKDNNELYIKNAEGKYVKATYADYYTATEFYKVASESAEYTYTGWQEIGGNTYFFDKNGNKVTGEQVIQGAKYNFDSTGALVKGSGTLGIDVSKWNGNINWQAVKNSGVSYVIIRCGYRGSTSGALIEDPKFRSNIKGANDAGLKVGIYFYSQATSDVEAVEEASMTLDLIRGYKISYPVFLDVEGSGGRGDKIDAATRTTVINAYCQTIRNGGYTPGLYANRSWLETKINTGSLTNCKIWLAQYNTAPTYKGHYDMWQYSDKGKVGGISVNTDMNLSYLGY